MLIQNQNLKNS